MSLRLRDLQQVLGKFTDGNKGTAISDCFIYMETDNGNLAEVGKIELQESRLIGKVNSSAAVDRDWETIGYGSAFVAISEFT